MKKVQAFKCSGCRKLFLAEKDAEACEKIHLIKRRLTLNKKKRRKDIFEMRSEVRNSVNNFCEVGPALEAYAKKLGYELYVDISGDVFSVATTHSHPINSRSRYNWHARTKEEKEFNRIYGRRLAFSGSISGTFSPGKNAEAPACGNRWGDRGIPNYFGDWNECFNLGFNTGAGGGGRGNFRYSLIMYVEDFPKILEQYKDYLPLDKSYANFLSLRDDRDEYLRERERLTKEYNADYFYFKKISDPAWAVYNQEIKDLDEELRLLGEAREKFVRKKRSRALELDDERDEKTRPDSDFDMEQYKRLEGVFLK